MILDRLDDASDAKSILKNTTSMIATVVGVAVSETRQALGMICARHSHPEQASCHTRAARSRNGALRVRIFVMELRE